MLGIFSRLLPHRPAPSVPEGLRLYAIGDIHGCATLLQRLLAEIIKDSHTAPGACKLVYLGDYIDRGPDSKGVIHTVLATARLLEAHHLRGNHDQVLLDFLDDPTVFRAWREFGAAETLMSYGVTPPRFDDESAFAEARDSLRAALPASHLAFLSGLKFSLAIGDYFFTHAGVRPGTALESQTTQDLMWIRDDFLGSTQDFGRVVVHGHSPAPRPVRLRNRIGIDTGAYATGHLTAAVLEGTSCRFLHT